MVYWIEGFLKVYKSNIQGFSLHAEIFHDKWIQYKSVIDRWITPLKSTLTFTNFIIYFSIKCQTFSENINVHLTNDINQCYPSIIIWTIYIHFLWRGTIIVWVHLSGNSPLTKSLLYNLCKNGIKASAPKTKCFERSATNDTYGFNRVFEQSTLP